MVKCSICDLEVKMTKASKVVLAVYFFFLALVTIIVPWKVLSLSVEPAPPRINPVI